MTSELSDIGTNKDSQTMRLSLTALFGMASIFFSHAQGTVLIQNNLGAAITYILTADGSFAKGANYSVEAFTYDPMAPGGFGIQLGRTITIGANGRFSAGEVAVPGAAPGTLATLIVRYWDNTTGATYDSALLRGQSCPFLTGALGGGGNPPTPAVSMVTGLPTGFNSLLTVMCPEPSTVALAVMGGLFMLWRCKMVMAPR